MSKKIFTAFLAIMLILSLAIAGCTTKDPKKTDSTVKSNKIDAKDIKIGFVYVGDTGDGGWTQAHDNGRKELDKLGVKTIFVENVKENADCEQEIRNLIDQGCNVIFSTSFGFMDWTANVADEFPNVKFFHCSGYVTKDNMSAYFGRIYQARYLSGIVAGLKTTSKKIGYVASMAIPEVVRGINAFTLGVRSVNPEATVEVAWTNTWYDPAVEKAAAMELLNKGCDVMAQHQDSTATQIAAEEKGAFAIGYDLPSGTAAPKAYLTAPLWNWGQYYVAEVQKIIDGTWKSSNVWFPMKDGLVKLDTLTSNCAPGTQEKVDAAQAKIYDGTTYIFEGPIKDNKGELKVKDKEKMTDQQMLSFDWFVEGVIGSVPKSK